jgi:3-hydroxyacyl-CoA dehydrogenase/enoyl-CoA hydratase/3-hydroxybutyryl-CoA epimerase
MQNTLNFSIDKNGIATLIFDMPGEKINKLSANVLQELEIAINVISDNMAIRVLLITSAKKDVFIAGADINEIKKITDKNDAIKKVSRGQNILSRIAKLKIPTIAIIDGACLGGGLELALACKYRVAIVNEKTILGLPEVNLGIIPGFGGTQRLPSLVGLQESLKIILSGKPINTNKAFKIGLIDTIIRKEFLENDLSKFITEILENSANQYINKREKAHHNFVLYENFFFKKYLIFYFAKKDLLKKTNGFYPAPIKALEVIQKTYLKENFKIELDAFCDLVIGKTAKNLMEIFFTNEELKKDCGVGDYNKNNKYNIYYKYKNIYLLGAGVMGGGIAWLFANKDINIRIKDITQSAIALGFNQVMKIFNQLKKIKKLTQEQINLKVIKITSCLDFSGFKSADFVIEAVIENMEIKKSILSETEKNVSKDTIIVSNTSSLSISEMSQALENPTRFAGMHFFNPVNKMPLVEVIRGKNTSDETIQSVVQMAKNLGKTPIVVKDVAGFLVNRILLPFMNEAAYLLQEGAKIKQIDNVIENFGMPMGPFILADVVGIDVGVKVAKSLQESYGERMKVAEILTEIYTNHKNLLGQKTKKGFYIYGSNDKAIHTNSDIEEILQKLETTKIAKRNISDEEILDRCILIMVNEAAKCLDEAVVKNAKYLDMAMIMGAGFPAFRGGILRYADDVGIRVVVDKIALLNTRFGLRFEPSKLLISMANENKLFYDNII